ASPPLRARPRGRGRPGGGGGARGGGGPQRISWSAGPCPPLAEPRLPRRSAAPSLLHLLQRARPVLTKEPGEGTVGQKPAAGLTARAVVGLVLRVYDALQRRAPVPTRLCVE